jgi:hypothetical protein
MNFQVENNKNIIILEVENLEENFDLGSIS